jgi:hypothetical protein
MIILYEDDILNLIIVTYHRIFKDIPDSFLHKFTLDTTEKSLSEIITKTPNETVVLIYSGSNFLNLSGENIKIIAKEYGHSGLEERIHENWYEYWSSSISDVDEEIAKNVHEYYHGIPSIFSRRLVECLKTSEDRLSLKNLLSNNSANSIQFQGRQHIEKLQHMIKHDNDSSPQKEIEGVNCTIVISNFLESAFQLLDRGFNNILLCKINLKQKEVTITIISKNPVNILDNFIIHKRGIFKTARISLETFISYL